MDGVSISLEPGLVNESLNVLRWTEEFPLAAAVTPAQLLYHTGT